MNPFAGVNAEEAQDDDKNEKESKDDGDENSTNPQLTYEIPETLIRFTRRGKGGR